jgi:hypothetical protein
MQPFQHVNFEATNAGPSVEKFLNIPYNARWEPLKATILRLYMEEKNSLEALAHRMKTEYSFTAVWVSSLLSPAGSVEAPGEISRDLKSRAILFFNYPMSRSLAAFRPHLLLHLSVTSFPISLFQRPTSMKTQLSDVN